ncbi:cytochrome p450 [Trichoderma arundinaceum]|uniref:Cytochrome p450 n=1 Tax=Trichoderma arundinaceum TaxID=490622 RepID=A0A395P0M6_TRIAR|nr:cytochrome p450 [Trichoderma arundinaceum]
MLYADATIAMVGGTGTGSTILSFSFYELVKDPSLQESLRAAIAPCYGKTIPGEFVFKDIDKVGWLDGFVNEILRLYPPMSTGLWRTTPPEGIILDGTFIPGNTQLMPCMYAIHRYSKFFEQPDELIVERWTTRPELIHKKDNFYPFLIGTLRCPGKRIALEMIKLTLAYTVWNYNFKFAPDADIKALHDKTVFQIVLKAGPLSCEFSKREEADSLSKA